jgi:hypothetical protein
MEKFLQMNKSDYENLTAWLMKQTQLIKYGSCKIELVIHAGEIRNIQKSATEKYKPEEVTTT